jgi:class 3 adenylate cyclase
LNQQRTFLELLITAHANSVVALRLARVPHGNHLAASSAREAESNWDIFARMLAAVGETRFDESQEFTDVTAMLGCMGNAEDIKWTDAENALEVLFRSSLPLAIGLDRWQTERVPPLFELWHRLGQPPGKARCVILLFDIIDSMPLQLRLPEGIWSRQILCEFFATVDHIAMKHGGFLVNPETGDGRLYGWLATNIADAFSAAVAVLGAARNLNRPPGMKDKDGKQVQFGVRIALVYGDVLFTGSRSVDLRITGQAIAAANRITARGRDERGDRAILVGADVSGSSLIEESLGIFLTATAGHEDSAGGLNLTIWEARPEPRMFTRDEIQLAVGVSICGGERCEGTVADRAGHRVRIKDLTNLGGIVVIGAAVVLYRDSHVAEGQVRGIRGTDLVVELTRVDSNFFVKAEPRAHAG